MHLFKYILLLSLCAFATGAAAQLGFDLAIKKPAPYENRELKAEKSGRKKWSKPRKFLQNTYTHYNYFFNANNKLNEVISRAKEGHQDDYSNLLSYYNYSLEATKADKQQLDSVMYKAKTGIVMHDLRNEWIDDLYQLWGQAYFLQNELDSAYQMFQFINYAFAPKEADGYYRFIGSRMDGSNARSIVTPEEDKFLKRLTTDPPSRNAAFVWQARTLTEAALFAEAGSLMNALRQDPAFPERLQPHLDEVQGYWFYKQGLWDSAAHHLVLALSNAQSKGERARWEYLIAQLFERSGHPKKAQEYYAAASDHTINPVMDVWARLAQVRLNKEGGDDFIGKNIAELEKMARKERFAAYRDLIYSMMGRMELERGNPQAAMAYMLKASKFVSENPATRTATFLGVADFLYNQRQYLPAASYYDSIDVNQLADTLQTRVSSRREYLQVLVAGTATVVRQDSLQKLASLPEAARTDALRKIARQMRRQRGLKEEETTSGNQSGARDIRNAEALNPGSMFNEAASSGEWYFYNPASRTSGAAAFRQVWGNRPNADNWRRASSVAAELENDVPNDTREDVVAQADPLATGDINVETLLQTLPVTPERLQVSNDSIRNALMRNGLVYLNEIEDYPAAVATFEELRRRFPDNPDGKEVLFRLQYAYTKAGRTDSAQLLKKALVQQYPGSTQAQIVQTGKAVDPRKPLPEATKAYERVYDMYLEGQFAEAEKAKRRADSMYQTNYWNPQLLYIESVYHIKQGQDSVAIDVLNTLIQQNPDAPIAQKAETLIEVLGRRKEIEDELRNLQLDKPAEEQPAVVTAPAKKEETPAPKPVEEPVVAKPVEKQAPPPVVQAPQPKQEPPVAKKEEKPAVVPDPEPQMPAIKRDTAQARQTTASAAPNGKDKGKITGEPAAKTPVALPKPATSGYSFVPDVPHYAVLVLNKVDNIYGNEARNAFTRFNKDKSYDAPPVVQLQPLDGENKLLLIGPFTDVLGAVNYVQQTKPVTGSQVVPWLKADKYSFTIISEGNLELLKRTPDLKAYQKFLDTTPVKL